MPSLCCFIVNRLKYKYKTNLTTLKKHTAENMVRLRRDGMGWGGMWWSGIGWDGVGCGRVGWDRMGWGGVGRDVVGWR